MDVISQNVDRFVHVWEDDVNRHGLDTNGRLRLLPSTNL